MLRCAKVFKGPVWLHEGQNLDLVAGQLSNLLGEGGPFLINAEIVAFPTVFDKHKVPSGTQKSWAPARAPGARTSRGSPSWSRDTPTLAILRRVSTEPPITN